MDDQIGTTNQIASALLCRLSEPTWDVDDPEAKHRHLLLQGIAPERRSITTVPVGRRAPLPPFPVGIAPRATV